MKPKINLHENEKLILECQPKKSLTLYLFISRCSRLLISLVLFAVFIGLQHGKFSLSQIFGNLALPSIGPLGLAVLFVAAILLCLFFINRAVNNRWYFFTDQRCIVSTGVFNINRKIIPYSKINDVDLYRSVLRSMFGISTVLIQQTGVNTTTIRTGSRGYGNNTFVEGLDVETAEKVSDLVSHYMISKS